MKKINFYMLGLLILIGLYFIFVNINKTSNPQQYRDRSGMMGYNNNANFSPMSDSNNSIDAIFIEQMIPHHEDAITMAKLALEKSQKPEMRKLAENIISSQKKEIDQMKEWYKSWYGKDLEREESFTSEADNDHSSMHMGMMGGSNDMDELKNSENFDKTFIEQMIPHHQMAVMMSQMLKRATKRDEMKNLASNIIEAQAKEIQDMKKWYVDWGYSN